MFCRTVNNFTNILHMAEKNKGLKSTIRIGDTSSLIKQRRVNTSAGCYLVRKNEDKGIELLVIKKVWPDGHTKFVLPKGHKEGGETLEETALRELIEESGYCDVTLLKYLGSGTYELDWSEIQMKTDHYYLAVLNSEREGGKQSESYEEGVIVENLWLPLDEGLGSLTYENDPEIHRVLKKYIKEDILG